MIESESYQVRQLEDADQLIHFGCELAKSKRNLLSPFDEW